MRTLRITNVCSDLCVMFEDSQACASMNQILKCFSAGESQWVLSCRCWNTVVVLMLILPLYNNSRLTLKEAQMILHRHMDAAYICGSAKLAAWNLSHNPTRACVGSFTLVDDSYAFVTLSIHIFLHDIKTPNELSASVTCLVQAYSLLHI